MLVEQSYDFPLIPYENLFCDNIDQFVKTFEEIIEDDIERGIKLNFNLPITFKHKKVSPILQLAKPEDIPELITICKEVYKGTYPYKEMEDEEFLKKKILSSNYHIIKFLDVKGNIIGCFKCILDFEQKKGYMGGFMLRSQYQKKIDVVKAIIGSYLWMWNTFKDKILVWYCENRTAQSTSQFMTSICGIKPIAFFPNKDIFYNNIESDVMGITYVEKVLKEQRSKKIPSIIPQALNCFIYSDNRYNLGRIKLIEPKIELNSDLMLNLKQKIRTKVKEIVYNNEVTYKKIKFYYKGSTSFFSFLYTPQIQNFEKTKYCVKNLEELEVFILLFIKCAKRLMIRYLEVLISAYEPTHQKLFNKYGLAARGYIPCWKYKKNTDTFDDYIVFNYFNGKLNESVELIPETEDLLRFIGLI
ncbi:MAG: hypothetical protein EU550_01865 [Promethearchaeota archaeon]|nr:MAG: hypothetical protein EU550_01865 [Candidatus Lokiarchaeota archaeon]